MRNVIKYEVGSNAMEHLIEVINDVELSYTYLKSKTKNKAVKSWIEDKLNYTTVFKTSALNILNSLKIKHKKQSNLLLNLRFYWFNIKRLFYKDEEQAIIDECIKLDAYFLNEVNKEIKSGILSKPCYKLINSLKINLLNTKQAFYFSNLSIS